MAREVAKRREGAAVGSWLRWVMFSIRIRRLITPTSTPGGGGREGGREGGLEVDWGEYVIT